MSGIRTDENNFIQSLMTRLRNFIQFVMVKMMGHTFLGGEQNRRACGSLVPLAP